MPLILKAAAIPSILFLVCLIAFTPSKNKEERKDEKQVVDSVDYYRRMTLMNYKLLKENNYETKQVMDVEVVRSR